MSTILTILYFNWKSVETGLIRVQDLGSVKTWQVRNEVFRSLRESDPVFLKHQIKLEEQHDIHTDRERDMQTATCCNIPN